MGTRIGMAAGLLVVFVGWALYRLLIKRDLMQHKGTLAIAGLFIGIWAALYWLAWA